MVVQYHLLFPYGERGFQLGVRYNNIDSSSQRNRTTMTMHDFYYYHFHYRPDQPNPFLSYGFLSSQAKVDAHACIDKNRLWTF
jgi:hypothetical protein